MWSFIVFILRRYCVSIFVCFIDGISILCFSACSRSCFCVFAVKLAKIFFIFSVSSSCFLSRLRFPSVKGSVSCSAAGLVSCLSGVQLELSILLCANSSIVRTMSCSFSPDGCLHPLSLESITSSSSSNFYLFRSFLLILR
jgi:hypothetical protein